MKRPGANSVPPRADGDADLAGALHEVSNALTVVLGWLDAATDRLPGGSARDAVDVARTHALLGHRIARAAIGAELERDTEQKSAGAVLAQAALGVAPRAEQRGVTVEIDPSDPGHALIRDMGEALQILTNLLLNAIDFSPEGSTVKCAVRDMSSKMIFSVADQGPGIDPDRVSTLLTAAASTRRGGAGVGLRHSAALAKKLGGELRIARCSPGACFELCWPVAEARSSVRPSRAPAAAVRGARVLVVEDDAAVRSLVELALEARGAQVVLAATREEFLSALETQGPFHAALMDLSPLQGDITAAFDRMQLTCPNIPIILISGVASGVPDELQERVTAWVRKPFEMGEVLDVLSAHLTPRLSAVSAIA